MMNASSSQPDMNFNTPTTARAPGTPPRSVNAFDKNTSSTLTTPVQDKSPASTFSESVSGASHRIAHSRSVPNVTTVSTVALGRHHGLIRSDSSVLTCFDPADKELHDLWAPK